LAVAINPCGYKSDVHTGLALWVFQEMCIFETKTRVLYSTHAINNENNVNI